MAARVLPALLWVAALALCAAAPVLFFIGGASDSATDADRFRVAAVPLVLAWLPLAVALRGRRAAWAQAIGLPALAGGVGLLAYLLAQDGGAFSGDFAWTLFWLGAAALWAGAARLALRAPRAPRARA